MKQANTIWVLGDGQLGAMLAHAGERIALKVRPVNIMLP
jgi:5-(carboxyamino)imidazole ribonucleotide synthase